MGHARDAISNRKGIRELLDVGLDEVAERKIQKLLAEKRFKIARDLYLLPSGRGNSGFSNWKKRTPDSIISPSFEFSSGSHVVVSEYPDMPKVLDALGLLPNGVREICLIEPRHLAIDAKARKLYEQLIDAEAVVLLDEVNGLGDAPIKTVSGSVEKVYGHFYGYLKADIKYFGDEIGEELAKSLLKQDLVFICKHLYSKLVPVKRGEGAGKKKSYKMSSVFRCTEFAGLLTLGQADYSELAKRGNKEKERAKALLNVDIPRELYPGSLRGQYDKVAMLKDVAKLWKAAAEHDRKVFDFSYADIDEGRAGEVMAEIGEKIGIASFIEAWEAGVPVEDIVA